MKSLLILACGLAFACAASAQPVNGNMAGSMSQSGAANVGAGAAPAFTGGAQMNGPDFRVQGRVQPGAASPTAPYLKPEPAKAPEEKREEPKPEPKPNSVPGT